MDNTRRKEIIAELKERGVEVELDEDGILVEAFIHDEVLDVFLRCIQTTDRLLET